MKIPLSMRGKRPHETRGENSSLINYWKKNYYRGYEIEGSVSKSGRFLSSNKRGDINQEQRGEKYTGGATLHESEPFILQLQVRGLGI